MCVRFELLASSQKLTSLLKSRIRACETKLAEAQNDHEQESALQEEKIKALNATVAEKDEQIQSLTAKLSTQEQRFADETKSKHVFLIFCKN